MSETPIRTVFERAGSKVPTLTVPQRIKIAVTAKKAKAAAGAAKIVLEARSRYESPGR